MSKFFDHFPLIDYPGFGQFRDFTPALDIGTTEQEKPYQQPAGTRPDVIAAKYYGDPVLEWLLFLANDIDNPYDLYYLTEDQFTSMINRKYGTIEQAQRLTKYYRNNFRSVPESTLTIQEYDSLPVDVKPLFNVVRNYRGEISGFVRKHEDMPRNTNLIYAVTVGDAEQFAEGSAVDFITGSVVNGSGQIAAIVDNTIYVEHIVNSPTGTSLTDLSSTTTITSSQLVTENISATEAPYFERVSMYDYLNELNEKRREIKVVDKRISGVLERKLADAFE